MDGLFAGTPPLEALRFLVHEAATVDGYQNDATGGPDEKVMMINDVARAFFEAQATRKVCVELPDECPEAVRGRNVALLNMSLYGTRDAAMNWQEEVGKEMYKWGFRRGQYNPCLYSHAECNIQVFFHGGDFASVGNREALRKFKTEM